MQAIRIGLVGGISSGKSATINCLVGANIAPMGIDKTTVLPIEYIHHYSFPRHSEREIVDIYDKISLRNSSLKTQISSKDFVSYIEKINFPSFSLEQKYHRSIPPISLFDFPGFNDGLNGYLLDSHIINFCLKKLLACHLIILILDVKGGLTSKDEIKLLENISQIRNKQMRMGFQSDIIVAINKCDQITEELKTVKESIKTTTKKYMKDAQFSLISSSNQLNFLHNDRNHLWHSFIAKINGTIRARIPRYYLYNLRYYSRQQSSCLPISRKNNYNIVRVIHKSVYEIERSLDCKFSSDDLDFIFDIYNNDCCCLLSTIIITAVVGFLLSLLLFILLTAILKDLSQ